MNVPRNNITARPHLYLVPKQGRGGDGREQHSPTHNRDRRADHYRDSLQVGQGARQGRSTPGTVGGYDQSEGPGDSRTERGEYTSLGTADTPTGGEPMSGMMNKLHDIWCILTHRCRPHMQEDQFMQYLKEEEQAALDSATRIRERRQHAMVATLRHQRGQGGSV